MPEYNSCSFDRVLFIDDNEIDILVNRRLVELTRFANEVFVTSTSKNAIDFLRDECARSNHAPDLIFLEIFLPALGGYDFLEAFTTLPEFIQLKSKVIILSVLQKPDLPAKIFDYPFVAGQFEKPLTQKMLRELAAEPSFHFTASS